MEYTSIIMRLVDAHIFMFVFPVNVQCKFLELSFRVGDSAFKAKCELALGKKIRYQEERDDCRLYLSPRPAASSSKIGITDSCKGYICVLC